MPLPRGDPDRINPPVRSGDIPARWPTPTSSHVEITETDVASAAARWAEIWAQAWAERDAETIAALYSDIVVYRSPPFREPDSGLADVRRYLDQVFSAQRNIECWFEAKRGNPLGASFRGPSARAPRRALSEGRTAVTRCGRPGGRGTARARCGCGT